jgi:hypothetical protein
LSAACRRYPGPRTHRSACSRSRETPHSRRALVRRRRRPSPLPRRRP